MKKLLLVLLVVALASFLFVGCLPTTPPVDGDGDGDGVAEVCPAITIAGSYAGVTKTYVKAPSKGGLEIVVTYGQPTEGSLVYAIIGGTSYTLPYYVSADGKTVYAEMSQTLVDKLESCETFMIKTIDCYGECICLQSFTIDSEAPEAKMKVSVPACACPGCQLVFESDYIVAGTCVDDTGCCLDDCSGLASWSIDVYKTDPYDVCCTIPCAEPEAICSGTACPIDCATDCLEGTDYTPLASPTAHYVIMLSLIHI